MFSRQRRCKIQSFLPFRTSASNATKSSSSGLMISSPKPNTDSIVDGLLNYDCMLHIFSYLSFADCLILASTHEYFRRIFRETSYARKGISILSQLDKLDLNMTELNLNRYNEKFALVYLRCCKHLTRLTIDSEYSSSLRINLQNLPHLTHLTVEGYRPIQVDPANNIQSLRLTDGQVYNGNRRRMRPADLTQFKNLRELQFDYYVGLSDSCQIDGWNKVMACLRSMESLRHLSLYGYPKHRLVDIVRLMPQLTRLSVRRRTGNPKTNKALAAYLQANKRRFRFNNGS